MIQGNVMHGDGVGKKLGFPTANIDCKKEDIQLGTGVYAAWAVKDNQQYPAALAVQADPWKVEAHLIGYVGDDFYGTYLEVDVVQKVSEMEKYNGREKLIEKIGMDVEHVREIMQNAK